LLWTGPPDLGVAGVAPVEGQEVERRDHIHGGPGHRFRQVGRRMHVEFGEPREQEGSEPTRQVVLLGEVDERETAAGRDQGSAVGERLLPGRNHREAIGKEDAVEAPEAEDRRVEAGRVALCQTNAILEARRGDIPSRRDQHRARDVDAVEARLRIAPCCSNEVAPGAAAELEHVSACRRVEAGDQVVAAQQEILPGRIVNMTLMAIDPIHQLLCGQRLAAHAQPRKT
jgi:hypothetical protein